MPRIYLVLYVTELECHRDSMACLILIFHIGLKVTNSVIFKETISIFPKLPPRVPFGRWTADINLLNKEINPKGVFFIYIHCKKAQHFRDM